METLKDIWASLVAGVQERTTNPLTFSFLASCCLWNYRFIFILTGDGTTAARLAAVDSLYPHGWLVNFSHAFVIPLGIAATYVFGYSRISKWVISYYRKKQVEIANAVRDIEQARVMTVEESSKLTRDHEAERTDWTKREADLQVQIQSLRNALATAEKEKAELKPQSPQDRVGIRLPKQVVNQATGNVIFGGDSTSKTSDNEQVTEMPELGEDKRRLLLLLSNYSTTVSIDVVAGNLKMNPTLANRGLRELQDSGLVARDSIGSWGLTERGEALAVKFLTSPEPT